MERIVFYKDNIVSVRYTNDKRDTVELVYGDENQNKIPMYIPVDANQPLFQEVLKYVDLDTIEENTQKWIEGQRNNIITLHKALIEKGYATAPAAQDEDPIPQLAAFMYAFDVNNEEHVEALFRLKLEAFDVPAVDAAATNIKDSIRQAATPLDLAVIVKGVLDNSHSS